ncbi:MAG: hypothetical protein EOP83_19465 [Verrucomicrobiaceae bacterium]|nr:MAG: hypothetical protein EOP83_19465 [Verrucomicrobiaceae bacterium]
MRSLRPLAILLTPLSLASCSTTADSDSVGDAVASTIVEIPFAIVGSLLGGDDDDDSDSDSSFGKTHVARQPSGHQPVGVR